MSTLRLPRHLAVGILTLLVWALAAGSAAYWLLRVGDRPFADLAPVAETDAAGVPVVDEQAVARALGAVQAPRAGGQDADLTGRLALRGILVHGAGGAALIAIDGQPAKPVRVGARVEGLAGEWVLRAISPHAVVLASGAREVRLEMPPVSEHAPATSSATLPSAVRPAGTGGRPGWRFPPPTDSPARPGTS